MSGKRLYLLTHFVNSKPIVLPSQARDKREQKLRKRGVFCREVAAAAIQTSGGRALAYCAPELLQQPPFGAYLRESNGRLGALQAKALRRLVAMLRNPGERCGDQTETREASLAALRSISP